MKKDYESFYSLLIESGYENKNNIYCLELKRKEGVYKREFIAKSFFDGIFSFEKEALSCIKKNDQILDIGAGGGRISAYLKKKKFKITSLEKSENICQILKKMGLKNVIKSDIFDYLPQKKYDLAIIFKVYSLLGTKKEDISRLLKFISQNVIKNKGKLLLMFVEPNSGKTRIAERRFVFMNQKSYWLKFLQPSLIDFIKILEKNNFEIIEMKKHKSGQYFILLINNLSRKDKQII